VGRPGEAGPAARSAKPADEVLSEVAKAIAETANLSAGEVSREQRLQLDLGLDSIGRLDLVGKLELRLNVSLPDDSLARMRTVGDLVDLVHAVRGKGRRSERRVALQERVWKSGEFKSGEVLRPTISQSILRGAMKTTEKVFFNTYLSIIAHGLENVPATGSFVMASNHSSHLDTAAVRAVLGRRAGDFHVMGAKDYFFDTRLKSWFFSTVFSALPFEREEHTLEGLGLCRDVLQNGKALLIFPEGGRTVTGKLRPFKPGIGILAVELDVPVLPVFVGGTFESLPKGRTVPRPSRVVVRFGAPLDFSELKARKQQEGEPTGERRRRGGLNSELYRSAAETLRAEVERLSQMK
jgi:long-chain acyl-CoA synthetase